MPNPSTRTLSIFISSPYATVYEFLSQPENLPQWAQGLGQGIEKGDGVWKVHTPSGVVTMVFANKNDYGVVDHTVYLPDGSEVYIPMRVVKHGAGSEVLFTLFRQPSMSDADYERDAQSVQQDLQRLQRLLTRA
tara:strand:- start:317176 stop:317577 length:402 start_codon:yes stop_codon:yes gene_type:complete